MKLYNVTIERKSGKPSPGRGNKMTVATEGRTAAHAKAMAETAYGPAEYRATRAILTEWAR